MLSTVVNKIGLEAPSPPSKPVIGHLLEFTKGELGCLYDALQKTAAQYGNFVQLKFWGQTAYLVSDIDAIKEVLVTRAADFPKGSTLDELKALGLGQTGLTELEGEEWVMQRRMQMPLYRAARIFEMFKVINSVAEKACLKLAEHPNIELFDFMNRTVLAVGYQTVFGLPPTSLDDLDAFEPLLYRQNYVIEQLMKRVKFGKLWKKLPIPSNFKIKQVIKEQKAFFEKLIVEHEKFPGKFDSLLANYMAASDEKGRLLDREGLYDQMQTFLGAGLETVGSILHWFVYFMIKNPDIEAKIYAEILSAVGQAAAIEPEHLKNTPLLISALAETMRLRPPFPIILREVAEDTTLGPYAAKKGSYIFVLVERIQTRADLWGAKSRDFDPSRFEAGNPPEALRQAFIPYGLGPRVCLGRRMADAELQIIAAHLIRKFTFELRGQQKIVPFLKFSWASKYGIKVKATARG